MIATSIPVPVTVRPVKASSLVRLKWRLWRNGFKRGAGQVAAMVLSIVFALSVGIGGFAGGIAARSASFADHRLGLTIAAAFVWLLAIIGPLIAGGIDDSLPLTNLTPYPIPRRTLAVGLVTASMIGPVPVGVGVAMLGAVIGASRSLVGAVFAAAAGVVLYLTLLVTAKVLPTVFARAMNSRKGRDAAVALASLASLSGIAMQFILRYFSGADGSRIRSFGRFASWTPAGALGRAMVNGGRGHIGTAAGGLAVGLVGFAALLAAYLWALTRMEEQSPAADAPKTVRVSASPLFPSAIRWMPRTAAGAIAARQVLFTLREPRRRVSMIMSIALGVVFPFLYNANRGPNSAVLFGANASWLLILSGINLFGMDGRALWFDLMSGASPADLVKGRTLGSGIFALPMVFVTSTTLAALTKGWAYLPAALLVGCASSLAGMGAAGLISVIAPMRVPEGTNPFAVKNSGQGCIAPLLGMLGLLAMMALLSPLAVALYVWRDQPATCALVGLVALPYGYLLWSIATKMAASRLVQREPELIELVDPRK
jgi:ABC-2 type transport system permease protein